MEYQNYMLDLRFEMDIESGKYSYCSCFHCYTEEEALNLFEHLKKKEKRKDKRLVYAALVEFKENRFFVSEKILLDKSNLS